MLTVTLTPVHDSPVREAGDLWGTLRITVTDGGPARILLECEWELGGFIAWYLEHRAARRTPPPFVVGPAESLATALQRATDELPDDAGDASSELDERLYAFRRAHVLRFGLRGAAVPAIVLGSNRGHGELSRAADDHEDAWSVAFDVATFEAALDREAGAFLRAWCAHPGDTTATVRAGRLLLVSTAAQRRP